METGLLQDYFGNLSTRGEIEPTQGEIETNIRKLGKLEKNPNFLFRWRGPLVMIFDRVGVGAGGGWQGVGVPDGGSLRPDQVARGS